MEANNFISKEDLQQQIKSLNEEKKDSIIFLSGKRVKIAIVLKSSAEYAKYENHLLQFDTTVDQKEYAVVYGVK